MDEIHQTHLSNILSFLHRKTAVNGLIPLRNAIQIQLYRNKPTNQTDERKKKASMCTHCFTYWKEGKFSVKFKPKYKSGENNKKRMILKCLVCNHKEYQSYQHHAADLGIDRREVKPITMKNNTIKSKAKKHNTKFASLKVAQKTKNNTNKSSKNKSKQKIQKK